MADEDKLDEIQRARQAAREAAEKAGTQAQDGKVVDFRQTIEVEGEQQQKVGDLDDQNNQTEIMHPTPKEVKLNNGDVLYLHTLSARQTVKFHGYAMSAVAQAGGRPQNGNPKISLMQLTAVLAEDDVLAAKLCYYASLAEGEPGKVNDRQAILNGAELMNKCQMVDYGRIYAALCSITNFDKVLQEYVGKKPQAPEEGASKQASGK